MKNAAEHTLPTCTFFMLVTNRDVFIADYAVASYEKLLPALAGKCTWKLIVYANCLTDKNKKHYFQRWKAYQFVEIYDNAAHCSASDFIPGSIEYSPEGWARHIEGPYESCDAVWTREFIRFTTDYWATVDADFEILSPDFVERAFSEFDAKENLVCFSSSYSPTAYIYESYSNRNVFLVERYHTIFCIYKKFVNAAIHHIIIIKKYVLIMKYMRLTVLVNFNKT